MAEYIFEHDQAGAWDATSELNSVELELTRSRQLNRSLSLALLAALDGDLVPARTLRDQGEKGLLDLPCGADVVAVFRTDEPIQPNNTRQMQWYLSEVSQVTRLHVSESVCLELQVSIRCGCVAICDDVPAREFRDQYTTPRLATTLSRGERVMVSIHNPTDSAHDFVATLYGYRLRDG